MDARSLPRSPRACNSGRFDSPRQAGLPSRDRARCSRPGTDAQHDLHARPQRPILSHRIHPQCAVRLPAALRILALQRRGPARTWMNKAGVSAFRDHAIPTVRRVPRATPASRRIRSCGAGPSWDHRTTPPSPIWRSDCQGTAVVGRCPGWWRAGMGLRLAGRSGRSRVRDVWSCSYSGAGYPKTFVRRTSAV
jgi:hypothetical protein